MTIFKRVWKKKIEKLSRIQNFLYYVDNNYILDYLIIGYIKIRKAISISKWRPLVDFIKSHII